MLLFMQKGNEPLSTVSIAANQLRHQLLTYLTLFDYRVCCYAEHSNVLLQAATVFQCTASAVTILGRYGGTLYSTYNLNDQAAAQQAEAPGQIDILRGTKCCSWVLIQVQRKTLLIEDCTTDVR